MSVLTALIQAILQVLCTIFPISQTAHSSMFHDFSNRFASGQSTLTGFVHIGIAVGIFVAMYRLFIRLIGEFFLGFSDLKSKKIRENSKKPAREFLYFVIISFLPLLFWLIPCGEKGTLYNALALTQVNKTLLDDGIFAALLGGMLIAANINITREKNDRAIWVVPAIASGVLCLFSATVSGLSLIGVTLCVLLLFGVRTKQALNFTFVLSFPVFLVTGIVEAATNEVKADALSVIVGLVVSAALSFLAVKVFRILTIKKQLKYFGIYDISFGVIAAVIGIFQLILR